MKMPKNDAKRKVKSESRLRKTKLKAVCMMSGGLDSVLAAKLVKDQGIEVYGICFTSPFFPKTSKFSEKLARQINIPINIREMDNEYLNMLRHPIHGYGSSLNPCTDCHIFMLKETKKYAKSINADIIVTGEVLGQRPKSQQMEQLEIVERESGLKGKLLRPLSAKLLPRTEAEKKGWININKLPTISGRGRIEQLQLAKQFRIKGFSSPSGGCLLTCRESAAKIRDILLNKKDASMKDMPILKIGRHFRFGGSKIIVGRNFQENMLLMKMKSSDDYFFEAREDIPSPITILQGDKTEKAIEIAAQLTAYYSDSGRRKAIIKYGQEKLEKSLKPNSISETEIEKLRINWR